MDLTPPSLTNSPYSPHRRSFDSPPSTLVPASCSPDTRSSGYASLINFDSVCSLSSQSYQPLIDPILAHTGDVGSPFASLASVPASVAWTTPDIATVPSPTMSTASTMPTIVTSDYNQQHGAYGSPCLPTVPYSMGGGIGRNETRAPDTISPSPDPNSEAQPKRLASFMSSKGSFSFVNSSLPQRSSMEDSMPYGRVAEPPQLPHGSRVHYSQSPHAFLPTPALAHDSNAFTALRQPGAITLARGVDGGTSTSMLDSSPRGWSRTKKSKRRPTRRHTTKEEANFQCQVKGCGKFFSRSYNFKSHMETHDDRRAYPFPCEVTNCSKRFVRKTDLQRHHQSVHSKERNYRCDYCGRLFARKDTQRRHMDDGCSKRFEVGMLEPPSEDYATSPTQPGQEIGDRRSAASSSPLPLPPSIANSTLNTVNGGLGLGLAVETDPSPSGGGWA